MKNLETWEIVWLVFFMIVVYIGGIISGMTIQMGKDKKKK